jgi:hypothetical protein
MSADVKLVAAGGSTLPTVRGPEALEMAINSALKVVDAVVRPSMMPDNGSILAALARAEALAKDLKDLKGRLDAVRQPATVKQIAALCARLVAAYPTKNRDPEFGSILFEEVAATQPSVGALEATVRHLTRTEKFLPSVAEVLEALDAAESRLAHKSRELEAAPERIEEAREEVPRLIAKREQRERDEVDDCYRRLSEGKGLSGYSREVIAKAQAQLEAEWAASSSRTEADDTASTVEDTA